ncbi:MAG: hypothetical protein IKP86_09005 [Anaerolineaceae bacterium]|nr:hypothetical protein [Anaerolineaceae bacterium]
MLNADPRETARYLGYRGTEPDETVRTMIGECIAAVQDAAVPRAVYERFPLIYHEDGIFQVASLRLKSRSLQRILAGCSEVWLFAATLGIPVDTLIKRTALMDPARGLVMQAAAAAVIEAYCEEVNGLLRLETEKEGLFLRPRFSPGYGDISLDCQRDFLYILKAQKNIGLTVTDSGLMVPVKSVTALIGISTIRTSCHQQGCEVCEKTDCMYRR